MNIRYKKPVVALVVITAAVGLAVGTKLIHHTETPARLERVAINEFRHNDLAQAFSIFYKLASEGNSDATFYLGQMYQYGDGVPRNGAKAVKWLSLAAKSGNKLAARQLGLLYLDGTDQVQNLAKAREWFGVAAKEGDEFSLRSLGDMNANGLGGPADPVKAYAYYAAAATRGSGYSAILVDRIAKRLDPHQQSEGEKEAEKIIAAIRQAKPASARSRESSPKESRRLPVLAI